MTSSDRAQSVCGRVSAVTCTALLATPVLGLMHRCTQPAGEVPVVALICAAVALATYVFAMPAKEMTLVGRTDSWR